MCFLTSFLIIPMGEPLRFTTWGIISGLFWVPGGWAGIYGIRTAGLAVAVGTWSSMIVLTSFFWGIFVFEESVKSVLGACCACGTLILGLIGMSIFAQPIKKKKAVGKKGEANGRKKKIELELVGFGDEEEDGMRKRIHSTQDESKVAISEKGSSDSNLAICKRGGAKKTTTDSNAKTEVKAISGTGSPPSSLPLTSLEMESLIIEKKELKRPLTPDVKSNKRISFFEGQVTLTKRQTGILACLFNGLWGGTNMIPLHFAAHDGYGGPSYVISFASGSMLILIGLWVLRFMYEIYRWDGSIPKAYHALPSFHFRQMWFQGGLAGLLYSAGNFMCIISVTYLGQGVGYSFTQASMLISGLW